MAVTGRAFGREETARSRRAALRAALARSLGAVAASFRGDGPSNANSHFSRQHREAAVELDCLRGILAPQILAAAAQRAIETATGADQVLVQSGAIGREDYLRRFCFYYGIDFETLADFSRADCPLADEVLTACARHGIIPLRYGSSRIYVYAPRNTTARRIAQFVTAYPELAARFRVTTPRRLNEFLERHMGGILAHAASNALPETFGDLSAAPMTPWRSPFESVMRYVLRLWRDAGARGFFTLNIIVGGNVLTALTHPILLVAIMLEMGLSFSDSSALSFFQTQFAGLYVATIAAGYLTTAIVGLIGLARRGLLHEGWVLLLTPIYWVCLSIAAWRALFQLLHNPYHWEKTEHGLAQSSRAGAKMMKVKRANSDALRFRDTA